MNEVLPTLPKTDSIIPQLSPEEIIAMRRQEILRARDSAFIQFHRASPLRFHTPGGQVEFFDKLFHRLENLSQERVRIVHYGDSQLEQERITASLREQFQQRFGGFGTGLYPLVPLSEFTYTTRATHSPDSLQRFLVYGNPEQRASHKRYGPAASVVQVDDYARFRFELRPNPDYPLAREFKRIALLVKGSGSISINGKRFDNFSGKPEMIEYKLSKVARVADIVVQGQFELYGLLLDPDQGVVMDNIAMRGCSGTIFTLIEQQSLKDFFADNVALVILEFGGNSVPYLKTPSKIEQYCSTIGRQIDYLRKLAPEAEFIFVGPADMSTKVGGQLQTYPQLENIIDALRDEVVAHGAAFWNMYDAMGGHNSMIEWVRAKPALAAGDFIHFSQKGAQLISELLFEAFDNYYQYYLFRNGKDDDELFDDNIFHPDSILE